MKVTLKPPPCCSLEPESFLSKGLLRSDPLLPYTQYLLLNSGMEPLRWLIGSLVAWASWKLARAGGGHSDARRARLSPGGCLQPSGGCLQPPDRLAFGPGG